MTLSIRSASTRSSLLSAPAGNANAFFTGGIFQVPVRIDQSFSFGQYKHSIRMNLSLGAGNQLASLSLPGDSFWMYRSSEPSSLYFKSLRGLTVYLLSLLSTKK